MMKKFTLLLFIICIGMLATAQDRYVDDVFDEIEVQRDLEYGKNITVFTVSVPGIEKPTLQTLTYDFYSPAGDDATDKPLVIMIHAGNFLPKLINGSLSGDKDDPYVVAVCERLARKGYAVASIDYRLGWNPISDNQDERTSTLINAAYRGVQDLNTAVRYFRKTVDEGNEYGIDTDKIVAWGIGTGGYVSSSAAGIDDYTDIVLPKFITTNSDGEPVPMVIKFIHGDHEGKSVGIHPFTGDTLSLPNHVEYSSEFNMSVNMGGAIGSETWIDEGDPAFIAFHVPTDPNAPYGRGDVVVPTTGDFVVEASGSKVILEKANELGLNDKFASAAYSFDDPYTRAANETNMGFEGLFPLERDGFDLDGDGQIDVEEGSPWLFWDTEYWSTVAPAQCGNAPIEQCNWHLYSLQSDPAMTFERASNYQDSIVGYFAPRACVQLDLPCASLYTSVNEVNLDQSFMTIAPNPSNGRVTVSSEKSEIRKIEVYSIDGRLNESIRDINAKSYDYQSTLPNGIYFIKSYFDEGVATERVIFRQ